MTYSTDTTDRTDEFAKVYITQCAIEHVKVHHPTCGVRGLRGILADASELDLDTAADLLDRTPGEVQATSRYFLSADCRGVLVMACKPDKFRPGELFWAVVTYIDLATVGAKKDPERLAAA